MVPWLVVSAVVGEYLVCLAQLPGTNGPGQIARSGYRRLSSVVVMIVNPLVL